VSGLLVKHKWLGRVMLDDGLPSVSYQVAYWLLEHERDGVAWPSEETLADLCGCSVRTIYTGCKALNNRGWITDQDHNTGTGVTRRRQINWEHLLALPERAACTLCMSLPAEMMVLGVEGHRLYQQYRPI